MTSEPNPALLRHASTTVHGRYFVKRSPDGPGDHWLVGFHGQGQTADAFLASLERVPRGPRWMLVSVQGLNRHYTRRGREIVANWMTSQDRELAIADNVAWVDAALDAVAREFGEPRAIVFGGFSQGVAMAYRAALLGRRPAAAIVACCGDVPPELQRDPPLRWPRVLAATGSRDEWYTPARLEADAAFLRRVSPRVEAPVFEGAHEWTASMDEATGRLLAGLDGTAAG